MSELKVEFPPEERPSTSVNVWINLIVALLIYAIYSNLNSLMQAWVGQKRVDFAIGVWVVHSVVVVLVAFMFWRRLTLPRVMLPRLFGARRAKVAS